METLPQSIQEEVTELDLAPGFVPDWHPHNYEDTSKYYSDATNTKDPLEWDIKTETPHQQDMPTDASTEPITQSRKTLEAVEKATRLEEALKAYDETYSLDKIEEGKQSPQLCAEVLLRIHDKFADTMSPEQAQAIALETVAVGEAIGHLAEVPDSESIDRTSLDSLTYMARIMDVAQTFAPGELDSLEAGMLKVAERVDSRAGSNGVPVSTPIQVAINEFKHLPASEQQAIPFTRILTQINTQINGEVASRTEPHIMEKMAEYEAAQAERKKAEAAKKLAQIATGTFKPVAAA